MLVVAIGVLALGLRLYQLTGRSLWLDEIFQAKFVHVDTFREVIANSIADVNQMPLPYVVTWLLRTWGDGEFILRLPAAVEGTLTVVAIYLLARALLGIRAGLVAALLSAIFPFMVWYSQEARSYALFMLFTTAQMLCAYTAVRRGRVLDWFGLAAFTILNLYTHYLALFPTAAAATYVGIFMLAGVLTGTSARVKAAAVSALAVIAAVGAFAPWRLLLKEARLNAALALALVVVALGLVITAAFRLRGRWPILRTSKPHTARQLTLAAAAGFIVAAAYAPWLPELRAFLNRPDQYVGRLSLDHVAGVSDVIGVFENLGFSGFLLAAFWFGLVALIVRLFRGKAAESGILIAWLGISVLLMLRTSGSSLLAIDVRYLAFLVPCALVVVAAGIEGAATGFELAVQRARRLRFAVIPHAASIASLLLVGLILIQALPALAASYRAPKQDWRGTAEHIAASSSSGSYVVAIGDYSDWSVLCLRFYFQRLHAPVTVINGRFVDSDIEAKLAEAKGAIWGVVTYPSSALLTQPSSETVDFADVTGHIHVLRAADPTVSTSEQARILLAWEAQLQPRASAS